jgi:hypothetical protein
MQFINNWIYQLTADWSASATDLPVSGDAKGRLGDGAYLLTLVNSADATEQTTWEIVGVLAQGGVYTVSRAQEGTAALAWPAGTIIYSGLTAGIMADISSRVDALEAVGGGAGGGAVAARAVTDQHLDVSLEYQSTLWPVVAGSTYAFPAVPSGKFYRLEVVMINMGGEPVEIEQSGSALPLAGSITVAAGAVETHQFLSLGGSWLSAGMTSAAFPT